MKIRTALIEDAPFIASLIYSAGPELYDFLYQTAECDSKEFIEFEFRSGQGFCGYPSVTVAVLDGIVVGAGCFFDGEDFKMLTHGAVTNVLSFYGQVGAWPVLERMKHVESVMKPPPRGELYLSNFGVNPDNRGQGIGRTMIAKKLEEARVKGYTVFGLDVAVTNTRAESLYKRLGLNFVEQKRFSGKREGYAVPDARKLELDLTE